MAETRSIGELLQEPFAVEVLGWKPQMVKNNRALAICYIDARDVMQRLDDVAGVENWQDDYVPLPDGSVMCKLSLYIDGRWVTKCDVGGESEQPDKGDREKAAFSDALKRAAVKFGIGRYLYSMPAQWLNYDPQKKEFTERPVVPQKFLPLSQRLAAPQKPKPPAPEQTPDVAKQLAKRFDEAASREAGGPVYQDYEKWLKGDGGDYRISATDKALVLDALKRFAERHPKPQPAKA